MNSDESATNKILGKYDKYNDISPAFILAMKRTDEVMRVWGLREILVRLMCQKSTSRHFLGMGQLSLEGPGGNILSRISMDLVVQKTLLHHKEHLLGIRYYVVVALWSILEGFAKSVVLERIRSPYVESMREKLDNILIPADVALEEDPQHALEAVVEAIEQTVKRPYGIDRLEAMLSYVEIGPKPKMDPIIRACLIDLSRVRNLIAHRYGKIDGAFQKKCKEGRAPLGDQFLFERDEISAFLGGVQSYFLLILLRIAIQNKMECSSLKRDLEESVISCASFFLENRVSEPCAEEKHSIFYLRERHPAKKDTNT